MTRRALTLIEVVAATVLLTLVVLACVPLLRGARIDLIAARVPTLDGRDEALEAAVDELLRQRPGLAALALDQPGGFDQRWTSGDHDFAASVHVVAMSEVDAGAGAGTEARRSSHAWLVFRTDGLEILRWVRLPHDRERGS